MSLHAMERLHECPECSEKFATAKGLGGHRRRRHQVAGSSSSAITYRKRKEISEAHKATEETAFAIKEKPRAPRKNHAIRASLEPRSNGIPEQTLALALGRFQQFSLGIAQEFDLPPRLFAARLAELIYTAAIR